MQVKIFDDKEDKSVFLRLVRKSAGVTLQVIDPATGTRTECGDILTITDDGCLQVCTGLNPNCGLQITPHNKIRQVI